MVLYLRRRLFHDQLLLSNWMMFDLLLSKTLNGCSNFPFQYGRWGLPYQDITEMTSRNQSVYKVEIIFRFRNSEICRSPCVTQPWQATWKRFYNFSKTFLLQALRSFAVHFDHIVIDHNNLVFLTPTSSPQPPGPPPPLQFDIQVLIRLNMGEDVNQKHYPRLQN